MDAYTEQLCDDQVEVSCNEISKLEEILKNYITNAQAANIEPLAPILTMMYHSSHNNDHPE